MFLTRICAYILLSIAIAAAQVDPSLYADMNWRMIGPFRGGRTVSAVGIPNQPNVFYIAATNGGVWKTDDFGLTWRPLFDAQPTQSIGAIAIAPSDPKIIYVGSGEGLQRPDLSVGDGIYKSTDGGETWEHLGLRDGQQIPSIIVDPRDPNRLFVAVLGHPYGPNSERGVYRSLDGGRTFQRVLYKDENVGAMQVEFDPKDPQTIYAVLWSARRPPWSVGNSLNGPGSGLFKSTDGGENWAPLAQGLPTIEQGLGRIGIAIASSDAKRMYAIVDAKQEFAGVYRSDDAGATWRRVNSEERIWGRASDFAEVKVDPRDPDKIYIANTSTYRSTDGGVNYTAIKGAPGGDDYHRVWINPENPDVILLGCDQGATISVNGGRTWSSWYNQPTAQFYHVITDNRFPYWVYGAQQESGSVGTLSRSDYGSITFRDWHTVGVEEYGYVAPDPKDPNIIYGGKASRYDDTTHQTQGISPSGTRRGAGRYRFNRTAPMLFGPDGKTLYLGSNVLLKTTDGGHSWQEISPELGRKDPGVPPTLGAFASTGGADAAQPAHRPGVVYSIAPYSRSADIIWIGTDDGVIQMTRDGGKHWQDVTPAAMAAWSKVAQLETSHFDAESCYAAVNRLRLDDLHPYIYRTHDGGRSWQKIVNGIPDNEPVNAVREDWYREGLLFAATERGVYFSIDDGNHWQSLKHNLPATSVRDIVVHGDDLVAGTHGRSFWILDDITPLRQLKQATQNGAFLFQPEEAVRFRRSTNTDTPLPPEIPAGQNPPDGAIIDYVLTATSGPVTLVITDSAGKLVRQYSSTDQPAPVDPKEINVPMYWVRPPRVLSSTAGMHRWVWDLRYGPPKSTVRDFPISAIPHDTPRGPLGPRALPGQYTVKLIAGGRTYTQSLTVKMDPRVKASPSDLKQMFDLEQRLTAIIDATFDRAKPPSSSGPQPPAVVRRLAANNSFAQINAAAAMLFANIDGADAAPTTQAATAVADLEKQLQQAQSSPAGPK